MLAGEAKRYTELLQGVPVGEDPDGYDVDGVRAKAVVRPRDLDELVRATRAASQEGAALTPWGGGTRIALGNTPDRVDIAVELTGLDRVIEHSPADLTATVEAGMTVAELQKTLGEHGQLLALDPPLPDRATIGGTLAVGLSGPLKWQYWSARDVVIGMKVVQADGTVTKSGGRVVKNVSGYDMARLHIGGLGTLGFIAEVSFKLTPKPRTEATVVAGYADANKVLNAATEVFRGDLTPLAMAVFDAQANRRMKATGVSGNRFLSVRLGGRPRTVDRQLRDCRDICSSSGARAVQVLEGADATGLWRSVANFGWDGATTPAIGARASVVPSRVLPLTEELERVGDASGLRSSIVSHPAHGTVLVGWYADGGVSSETADDLVRRARSAAHKAGGSMIVEQCPSEAKSRFDVWDEIGEPLAIMRRMKKQYDPQRVLNPGRFVGGI